MLYRNSNETIQDAPIEQTQLPRKYITEFISGDTTPLVLNGEYFVDSGIATTITDFEGGSEGQTIRIWGKGTLTVSHNANIKTNTGANKLLANDLVYRFTYWNDNVWREDA